MMSKKTPASRVRLKENSEDAIATKRLKSKAVKSVPQTIHACKEVQAQ
jgi:hypothetical protein